ncbi:MAG: Fic family protein [Coriobacteriia bacterium]
MKRQDDGSLLSGLFDQLSGARLEDALQHANNPYLFHADFIRMPLPEGVDQEAAWRLLDWSRRVSRRTVYTVPGRDEVWYFPADEITRHLHRIDMLAGWPMQSALRGLGAEQTRFSGSAAMKEAVAACIDREHAHLAPDLLAHLRHGSQPQTTLQQQIANYYDVVSRIEEYARMRFDISLIERLQSDLSRGLVISRDEALRFRDTSDADAGPIDQWAKSGPSAPEKIGSDLKQIESFATDSRSFLHPMIKAIVIYFWIEDMRPFAHRQPGLARLLFLVFLRQQGYANLQLLPLAQITLERARELPRAWRDAIVNERDLTGFLMFNLEAIVGALEDLQQRIELASRRYDAIRNALQSKEDLNHRQCSILGRALRMPSATFTIAYHKRAYNVAYATARGDLMDLVEKGYLEQRRESHEYVFTPAPELAKRLQLGIGGT